MSGARVLLTGGFGNVGSWLIDELLGQKADLTVLSSRGRRSERFRTLKCDVTSLQECAAALSGSSFEIVIHAASANDQTEPDYFTKALTVNALGTRNLLEALPTAKLRHFVLLSTFQVYGRSSGEIDETTPAAPRSDYALTHLFAEDYVRRFNLVNGLPYSIVRLTNGYGCPRSDSAAQWPLLLNDLARGAFQNKEIRLKSNGRAQREFIWMKSAAQALVALANVTPAPDNIFNLGSGVSRPLLAVAEAVKSAYKKRYGKDLAIHLNEADKTDPGTVLKVSTEKLRSLINYSAPEMFEQEADALFALLEQTAGQI
jgi:UDP-glucose 4-epimerase